MYNTTHLRPQLTVKEQIDHLKTKGIKFELCSEEDAEEYLKNNNNYFKLRSYRKNFEKIESGEQKGKYINLDFEMLKDLAIIDMRLRYILILISFDIEHFEKVKLVNIVSESPDDGYNIVEQYINSLDDNLKDALQNELKRNAKSEYCKGIYEKYNDNYPIWAFVEIIPFGQFIEFLKFCADFLGDEELKRDVFLLIDVKRLRNASAHNNCIISDLHSSQKSNHKADYRVMAAIDKNVCSPTSKKRRMSNHAVKDIVTLFYAHRHIVTSEGVLKAQHKNINEVIERCFKHYDYYSKNELIKNSFNFLKKVVDKFYDL